MGQHFLATLSGRGRHQQSVSRYETGERRLDVVEFMDVARILACDVQSTLTAII